MRDAPEKFSLTDEAIAALLEAVSDEPEKLHRLEERLVRDREQAARRAALEQRIAKLRARNTTLRDVARPSPPPKPHSPAPSSVTAGCTSSGSVSPTLPDTPDEFDEATIRLDTAPVPATWGRQLSVFCYRGPTVKGMVSSVIDGGVLYRILTDGGDWAFYNDSRYYSVEVRYRIAAGSVIQPGPSVVATARGAAAQELAMQLGPEETRVLLSGRVVDFESLCSATLLPKRAATEEEEAALCAEPQQYWEALATSYPRADEARRRKHPPAQLLAHCVSKGLRFVDPQFPPSHASLYRDGADSFYLAPLHWHLPTGYLPNDEAVRREVRLFRGPALQAGSLRTGQLFPNHLLLAATAGLACRWPRALRRLFFHPQGSRQARRERAVGAHHVELCAGGWWRPWHVDEFLPASAHCPEFGHNADDLRVLWFSLLEKACAKALGSYAAMLEAPLEHYVAALTGGPCMMLRELWPTREDLRGTTGKASRFFSSMTRLLRGRPGPMPSVVCWLRPYSLTTARTQERRDRLEELYGNVGIHPSVPTVVLGLETLSGGQCLVRLRQTAERRCTTEEWLRLWRDVGKSWVDEVGDLVFGMDEAVGETVWMELQDLPQYFQGGCVAPVTTGWASVKVQGRFTERQPSVVLQVTVTVPTRLLVSVTQGDLEGPTTPLQTSSTGRRFSVGPTAGRALAGLSCLVYSKDIGEGAHFVGGNSEAPDAFELAQKPHFVYERDVTAGHVLDPREGPYYVAACAHATSPDVPFTITAQLSPVEARGHAAPPGKAEGGGTATVRFLTAKAGTPVFHNLALPVLRPGALEGSAVPLNYQSCPAVQPRVHYGTGIAVTLGLDGTHVN